MRRGLVAFSPEICAICAGDRSPPQGTAPGHPPNRLDLTVIFSTDFFSSVNIVAFSFPCPCLAAEPPPPKALNRSLLTSPRPFAAEE